MTRGVPLLLLAVATLGPQLAVAQPKPQRPQESKAPATLDEEVKAASVGFRGKLWVYAKNLDSGVVYSLRGDERVRTASTIKLPIMVTVFAKVAAGKARFEDELELTKEKKVSGSGVLGELHDGLRLTLRDAVNLMIVVSDNTATNLVLDVVDGNAVNEQMEALGLKRTQVLRKIGGGNPSKANEDPVSRLFGIGVSTPREMVTLLEKLERGEVVSPEASREMIEILKREQYEDGIGRTLYDVPIASKSGALDRLRSDVAIVYTKRGRIAMAITCDDTPEVYYNPENPSLLLISRISLLLLEGLAQQP
jgi:beta-lactamase class A